ncbi:MAG: D-inositol-3-phosphate glycosyltransferase [Corynebacteriales bacterium]|nr:D-inositol-3-phosphate glycosyltransferase [Mycobacteriales bacterium]
MPPEVIRRVATISMHTSPLAQPGTGDAGGMNVYLANVSKELAKRNVEVEIFTRATSSDEPPVAELAPGVTVRHVPAGPFEGNNKDELPELLCSFVFDVLRTEAHHEPGHYDVVHSHYWLSGQVGRAARRRWGVPLVHTAHTLARVKNAGLRPDEVPEPDHRIEGEELIVTDADALVANTDEEASQLIKLYDADPLKIHTVTPGVDLEIFHPGSRPLARKKFGLPQDAYVVLFVGRLQALKGPDVLVRAAAQLAADPNLRPKLRVVVCGGTSGDSVAGRIQLEILARTLGVEDVLQFVEPLPPSQLAELYRAADVTVVPSRSESFGLVAVESAACGTPVVAAEVGGLRTAVAADVSGLLVDGHEPSSYASVLHELAARPDYRAQLSAGGLVHARNFRWQHTADGLLAVYKSVRAEPLASLTT